MNRNETSWWFLPKGRLDRVPYLLWNFVGGVLGWSLEHHSPEAQTEVVLALAATVLLVGYVCVMNTIKRAHDRDRSGWFALLFAVPLLNFWPIIELAFVRGTEGDNRFGPDPLQIA